MAADSKSKVDGNQSWTGGMDTARAPNQLDDNQYVYSVNCQLAKNKDSIATRAGYRCVNIIFNNSSDEQLYGSGNIQDCGHYFDGTQIVNLVSVAGRLFELRRINKYTYKAGLYGFQNNPNLVHAYITTIPFGAIINDGQSLPIYLYKGNARRTNTKNREIGPGLNGIYVQNRFFYVLPDRKNIYGSTLRNPQSLEEAQLANIYGFIIPEEEQIISAIGKQKTIARDAAGGNLTFASPRNHYSVDVRGDRTSWGLHPQTGIGFVDNSIPDIGASSPYSYESFNGNVYFRNSRFGMMSVNQSQFQFTNLDSYSSNSIEAQLFYSNDTINFLSKCYSKSYKDKLYTTIAPQQKDGKYIYWNGIIVFSPDAYYATKDRANINRHESVYTGIRPWCLSVSIDPLTDEEIMLVHSYDYDGVNRMYLYDENIDYDVNQRGEVVEIESKVLTRSYFKDGLLKQPMQNFYSLSKSPPRDINITIATRPGEEGYFTKLCDNNHPAGQSLNIITTPIDPPNINGLPGNIYFNRQDLITMKGPAALRRWIRLAESREFDKTVYKNNSTVSKEPQGIVDLIFTHKISQ